MVNTTIVMVNFNKKNGTCIKVIPYFNHTLKDRESHIKVGIRVTGTVLCLKFARIRVRICTK